LTRQNLCSDPRIRKSLKSENKSEKDEGDDEQQRNKKKIGKK